jgi:hypothetical protein
MTKACLLLPQKQTSLVLCVNALAPALARRFDASRFGPLALQLCDKVLQGF